MCATAALGDGQLFGEQEDMVVKQTPERSWVFSVAQHRLSLVSAKIAAGAILIIAATLLSLRITHAIPSASDLVRSQDDGKSDASYRDLHRAEEIQYLGCIDLAPRRDA